MDAYTAASNNAQRIANQWRHTVYLVQVDGSVLVPLRAAEVAQLIDARRPPHIVGTVEPEGR